MNKNKYRSRKNNYKNNTLNSKKRNNLKHEILGNNNIDEYCRLFNKEKKRISVKVTRDNLINKKIHGITVPHAGFEYSGFFGLYAVEELLKSYENRKKLVLTILWFLHNPNSYKEHSFQNIIELLKCNYPNIKIKEFEVNKNVEYKQLKKFLKPPFIISTDFSHHNSGNFASSIIPVWENDKKVFMNNEILNSYTKPCGNQPLRILKNYCSDKYLDLNLIGYSNSKNKYKWWITDKNTFEGVTYGALACYNRTWYNDLYSNMLAYPHLHWVDKILKEDNTILDKSCIPGYCGLFWSFLLNIKGSCFITINDKYGYTYSCMGYWQTDTNSLLECLFESVNIIKSINWHKNLPINKNILVNYLQDKYSIVITLIEPIENWSISNKTNKNKGYVYYNNSLKKVGMTYLPSVWELYKNETDFFKNLEIKHKKRYKEKGWALYSYNSISWTLNKNLNQRI